MSWNWINTKYPQLKYPELDFPKRPYLSFNGSIVKGLEPRQNTLHKQILLEETELSYSVRNTLEIAKEAQLYQFFPYNYIDYLIMYLYKKIKKMPGEKKLLHSNTNKLSFLLAGLTLIYTKEEKYIPNSTIETINSHTGLNIKKNQFFRYYHLIAKSKPEFYSRYPRNQQQEFINCFRYTITQFQRNGESNSELISIHKKAFDLCKEFTKDQKFRPIRPSSYETYCKILIVSTYCKITSISSRQHFIPFDLSKPEKQTYYQQKFRIKEFLKLTNQLGELT